MYASFYCDTKMISFLAARGARLNDQDISNHTALMFALQDNYNEQRKLATVKALIKAGANPRLTDLNGHTVLDHAKEHKYNQIIEILKSQK